MEMWGMEQNGSSWGARGGWDGGPLPDPQLPFEKNCGEDNQCVPDLRVALSFSGYVPPPAAPPHMGAPHIPAPHPLPPPPRLEELVVGVTEEVTVTVTVHNVGEDAYGAHVELQHPKALSYRKATALQVPTGSRGTTAPQGLPHIPPGPPEPLQMLSGPQNPIPDVLKTP